MKRAMAELVAALGLDKPSEAKLVRSALALVSWQSGPNLMKEWYGDRATGWARLKKIEHAALELAGELDLLHRWLHLIEQEKQV